MLARRPAPVIGKLSNSVMSLDASTTSPRSPFDFKILSPRGPISCDRSGVGLGIVAAMEKYSDDKTQTPAIKQRNSSRSDPIPMTGRVCYDGSGQKKAFDLTLRRSNRNEISSSIFTITSPRFGDFPNCPPDDFLSECHMCQMNLNGKDIYMYRGEIGFCSTECRCKQIVIDEKKEKYCSGEFSISISISSPPCQNNGWIFSPGNEILAI